MSQTPVYMQENKLGDARSKLWMQAHEVSVAVTHQTRDGKVSSSMLTCSCTFFLYAYMCI